MKSSQKIYGQKTILVGSKKKSITFVYCLNDGGLDEKEKTERYKNFE